MEKRGPKGRANVWMAALAIALGSLPACQRAVEPLDGRPAIGTTSSGPAEAHTSPAPLDPPGHYLGRRIAPTMSHEGAAWLTRPEREVEESTSRMLRELSLSPGDVVCDLGAGNGYHTIEMAKTVGPKGRAIAVDIQPEMLELLRERAKAAKVPVETILGASADPHLPPTTCDLVLMADVYHELDDPAGMLTRLRAALTDRGQLALLEFRGEDDAVPIKREHKMTRAQIQKELEANGYRLVRSFDELPWQHLVFYEPRR